MHRNAVAAAVACRRRPLYLPLFLTRAAPLGSSSLALLASKKSGASSLLTSRRPLPRPGSRSFSASASDKKPQQQSSGSVSDEAAAPRWSAVGLGAAAGLVAAAVYFGGRDRDGGGTEDHDFEVMAALEVREELEKVRLAQLIHDLHRLAREKEEREERERADTQHGAGGTGGSRRVFAARRYVTMAMPGGKAKKRRPSVAPPLEAGSFTIQEDGDVSADFAKFKMTPELAQTFVQVLTAGGRLSRSTLLSLFEAAKAALRDDPTLVDLADDRAGAGEVAVVGDLHGSLHSLSEVLAIVNPHLGRGGRCVFNGDFVDRGEESLEVLCILLLLKLAHPDSVVLLRGNHEDDLIASVYGFRDEIRAKYGGGAATAGGGGAADDVWDAVTRLFPLLPLAARTETAAILHGGLPGSSDFDLDDVAAVSVEERSRMLSAAVDDPGEGNVDMVQKILWSDPDSGMEGDEVKPNPRGAGVKFGRAVARDFLRRHSLRYLVRSHEPVKGGIEVMDCGDGDGDEETRKVITVFSTAAYPGGQGSNKGAVLHLLGDGSYAVDTFGAPKQSRRGSRVASLVRRKTRDGGAGIGYQTITRMIATNRSRLEAAFREVEHRRHVSIDQWAETLAAELDLHDLPWKSLQRQLAPTRKPGSDWIDWRAFLERHAAGGSGTGVPSSVDDGQIQALHANQQMLRTVFKFLDEDRSGSVDMDEFRHGIELLNKYLPDDRKLKDPETLFRLLDKDGNGSIDIDEFGSVFSVL